MDIKKTHRMGSDGIPYTTEAMLTQALKDGFKKIHTNWFLENLKQLNPISIDGCDWYRFDEVVLTILNTNSDLTGFISCIRDKSHLIVNPLVINKPEPYKWSIVWREHTITDEDLMVRGKVVSVTSLYSKLTGRTRHESDATEKEYAELVNETYNRRMELKANEQARHNNSGY